MKVSTSKASSIFKDILAEKSRRLEMAWPGTGNHAEPEREPIAAPIAPESVAIEMPVVEIPAVEEIPAPLAPVALAIVEPMLEIVPEPVVEPPVVEPIAPIVVNEPVVASAPVVQVPEKIQIAAAVEEPMPAPAPAMETSETPEAPAEQLAEVEIEPASRRPKAPKLQDLLGSNDWIRSLTRRLIDSENAGARNAGDGSAPIKELWNRLREESHREKRIARMEAISKQCAKERLTIAPKEISDLKLRFLHAIRRVQEPYRSTLIYHYCEGLSVGEMVDRLGISGWIIRERLAKSLEQLDHILAEELGKEKTKRYVLLAHLGEN